MNRQRNIDFLPSIPLSFSPLSWAIIFLVSDDTKACISFFPSVIHQQTFSYHTLLFLPSYRLQITVLLLLLSFWPPSLLTWLTGARDNMICKQVTTRDNRYITQVMCFDKASISRQVNIEGVEELGKIRDLTTWNTYKSVFAISYVCVITITNYIKGNINITEKIIIEQVINKFCFCKNDETNGFQFKNRKT